MVEIYNELAEEEDFGYHWEVMISKMFDLQNPGSLNGFCRNFGQRRLPADYDPATFDPQSIVVLQLIGFLGS
ncbi:hypothetical protein FF2_035792 [Malus domestica]